jgi:hypothetical protein
MPCSAEQVGGTRLQFCGGDWPIYLFAESGVHHEGIDLGEEAINDFEDVIGRL